MFIVESIQSLLLEVLLFNWIFNWCLLTKGRWNVIENHEKCSWSVQVTSSVTCLETFRNIKMHCSVTWINLVRWIHRLCYHSHLTRDPSCTKLRLGSTVLSFSLVNRFPAGKANQKVFQLVGYVRIKQILLHQLHFHSRDYCDIRRTDFGKTALHSL